MKHTPGPNKAYAIRITRPNGEINYVSGNNLHKNIDFCTIYTDQALAETYRKSWEKDCGVGKAALVEINIDEDWNILLAGGKNMKRAPGTNENCACRIEGANFVFCSLHAAAPEMCETLQDALEWIETGKVDGVGFDEPQVVAVIRTAIAKAEGRG